jgi:hypothetical protein
MMMMIMAVMMSMPKMTPTLIHRNDDGRILVTTDVRPTCKKLFHESSLAAIHKFWPGAPVRASCRLTHTHTSSFSWLLIRLWALLTKRTVPEFTTAAASQNQNAPYKSV